MLDPNRLRLGIPTATRLGLTSVQRCCAIPDIVLDCSCCQAKGSLIEREGMVYDQMLSGGALLSTGIKPGSGGGVGQNA
jgi:hypothetical protein